MLVRVRPPSQLLRKTKGEGYFTDGELGQYAVRYIARQGGSNFAGPELASLPAEWHIINGLCSFLPIKDMRGTLMANSLNLSLTDELRAFIDKNSGNGTLYATPSEFVRDILSRHKAQEEAAQVRDAILEGYQDAIAGRTIEFKGNLKTLLKKARK